jgi:hypothetical protein
MKDNVLYREEFDALIEMTRDSIRNPPNGINHMGMMAQMYLLEKLMKLRDTAPGAMAS